MKEELTTLMHMEFCTDEDERIELAAHGVFDAVFYHKKKTMNEACKLYGISEEVFWENMPYKRILSFPTTSLEELRKNYPYFTEEEHNEYKACKTKEEICELNASYQKKYLTGH